MVDLLVLVETVHLWRPKCRVVDLQMVGHKSWILRCTWTDFNDSVSLLVCGQVEGFGKSTCKLKGIYNEYVLACLPTCEAGVVCFC